MRVLDIVSSVLLIALAAYVIHSANQFPLDDRTLGPEFFPKLVAGFLIAFALALVIQALLRKKTEKAPLPPSRSIVLITASMIVYVILMPIAGFLVITPAFLVATGLMLSENIGQWWKKVCLSAVVCTGVMHYLFATLLNVPLP